MRLPRMTTRRMMILVGWMALVFGVAVEIRRALNISKREYIIAECLRLETRYLQSARRAQAQAKDFAEMEHRALELVRTGEWTNEAGQKRVQARRRQREFWEAARDASLKEARWYAGRAELLRMEVTSGRLFDHVSERHIHRNHIKKVEAAIYAQKQKEEAAIYVRRQKAEAAIYAQRQRYERDASRPRLPVAPDPPPPGS